MRGLGLVIRLQFIFVWSKDSNTKKRKLAKASRFTAPLPGVLCKATSNPAHSEDKERNGRHQISPPRQRIKEIHRGYRQTILFAVVVEAKRTFIKESWRKKYRGKDSCHRSRDNISHRHRKSCNQIKQSSHSPSFSFLCDKAFWSCSPDSRHLQVHYSWAARLCQMERNKESNIAFWKRQTAFGFTVMSSHVENEFKGLMEERLFTNSRNRSPFISRTGNLPLNAYLEI